MRLFFIIIYCVMLCTACTKQNIQEEPPLSRSELVKLASERVTLKNTDNQSIIEITDFQTLLNSLPKKTIVKLVEGIVHDDSHFFPHQKQLNYNNSQPHAINNNNLYYQQVRGAHLVTMKYRDELKLNLGLAYTKTRNSSISNIGTAQTIYTPPGRYANSYVQQLSEQSEKTKRYYQPPEDGDIVLFLSMSNRSDKSKLLDLQMQAFDQQDNVVSVIDLNDNFIYDGAKDYVIGVSLSKHFDQDQLDMIAKITLTNSIKEPSDIDTDVKLWKKLIASEHFHAWSESELKQLGDLKKYRIMNKLSDMHKHRSNGLPQPVTSAVHDAIAERNEKILEYDLETQYMCKDYYMRYITSLVNTSGKEYYLYEAKCQKPTRPCEKIYHTQVLYERIDGQLIEKFKINSKSNQATWIDHIYDIDGDGEMEFSVLSEKLCHSTQNAIYKIKNKRFEKIAESYKVARTKKVLSNNPEIKNNPFIFSGVNEPMPEHIPLFSESL